MYKFFRRESLSLIGNVVLVILLVAGLYAYTILAKENQNLSKSLRESEENLASLELEHKKLSIDLSLARGDIEEANTQLDSLSTTLDKLKKLAETDRELLRQYSKVYFLSENYIPKGLTDISPIFVYNQSKPQQVLVLVYPFLQRLLEEANENDYDLKILSSYRSFGEQTALKSAYSVTYGESTANQFSADQGYSEHQLGTTVDFTTTKLGSNLYGFDKTKEYKWLLENAYKHGFVLSYPEDNGSYIFEPWHWRFVGVSLAKRLYEEKQAFYTLQQRQIDAYLVNLFDSEVE